MEALEAKGRNGQIHFDGKLITIKRAGFAGKISHGGGENVIPLKQISGVQLKPNSKFSLGYIQFLAAGNAPNADPNAGGLVEKAGRLLTTNKVWNAGDDPNAVLFTKKVEADFIAVRNAVILALAELN